VREAGKKPLLLALPSKGRLMEAAESLFARAGYRLARAGAARSYRGDIDGLGQIEVVFLSAAEIAQAIKLGATDLAITGEDLLRDAVPDTDRQIKVLLRLGFGPAEVVVAVPECWLDVATMADLDEISHAYYARHGRRLRIATKYVNLTRRFFAEKGVAGYRIVESLGATEGAPASGTAEAIVDITTTGATLKANGLRVLDDGVILRSEAVLAGRAEVARSPLVTELRDRLEQVL
jgi:ATP phosphoribosyltransferase